MASLDLFLDAPAIPSILRLLLDKAGGDRLASVVESLPDRAYTEKAIAALRGQGIIEERNGLIKIVEGEEECEKSGGDHPLLRAG